MKDTACFSLNLSFPEPKCSILSNPLLVTSFHFDPLKVSINKRHVTFWNFSFISIRHLTTLAASTVASLVTVDFAFRQLSQCLSQSVVADSPKYCKISSLQQPENKQYLTIEFSAVSLCNFLAGSSISVMCVRNFDLSSNR